MVMGILSNIRSPTTWFDSNSAPKRIVIHVKSSKLGEGHLNLNTTKGSGIQTPIVQNDHHSMFNVHV